MGILEISYTFIVKSYATLRQAKPKRSMTKLVNASAYIIERFRKSGDLFRLGKTKLYKTLFLADWITFRTQGRTLFNIEWLRLERGPALESYEWDQLCEVLNRQFSVRTKWIQNYHPQIAFDVPGSIAIDLDQRAKNALDEAIDTTIGINSQEAASLTYQTEPMKWLLAKEHRLGGHIQHVHFRIDDPARIKFQELALEYVKGEIDIPEIAKVPELKLDESEVVVLLEFLDYHRRLENLGASSSKRADTSLKILDFINKKQLANHAESVEAEVIASQRIEGIVVSPDTFAGEN